jgi:hypothetical protein
MILMTDKIARAYLAMQRPKHYPVLDTLFGGHSAKKIEEVFVSKTYSVDDPYSRTPELADRLHSDNKATSVRELREYSIHSTPINSALRKHHADPKQFNELLHATSTDWGARSSDPLMTSKAIDQHLSDHEASENFHLYTGIPHSPFRVAAVDSGNHVAHLPAFTSATTKFQKAMSFAEPDHETKHDKNLHGGLIEPGALHILKLNVNKGDSVASIRHFSANPEEDEMLVNRGYDITIHPRPVKASGETNRPVYVWSATLGRRRPRPIQS